jgi:hypothetical protein
MCFTCCVWIPILLVNSLKLGNIPKPRTGNGVVLGKKYWRYTQYSIRQRHNYP